MSLFKRLGDWLDDRTGYRELVHESLYENIPGGSRWRYVSGSMLVFAFVTQVVTGFFLWACYSPSSQNAWESVYYIQNEMTGGWLLRGVHHFMAQAMVVLLPVHLLQVVIDKAYKAPREINYWLGLVLMLLVLGLGLTGYLLPWDQKGYWATKVATNLTSLAPGGEQLQKLAVGGEDYGHHTLTRFFALHAGILPTLLVIFLGMHVAMFRRHGITAHSSPNRADQYFWPRQVLKDVLACALLLMVVLLAVIQFDVAGLFTGTLDREHLGAELGAPADPSELYSAARPEWYFLFLFQLLKKFKSEFIGAIVVPTAILGYLFLLPLIAKVKFGHVLNVVVILGLMAAAGYLTFEAMQEDNYAEWYTQDPEKFSDVEQQKAYDQRFNASRDYQAAVEGGHREYRRVHELVQYYGIPREGVMAIVREDSEIQGPRLFKRYCASCHSYLDEAGEGIASLSPAAPNLYGIGSPRWFMGYLSLAKEHEGGGHGIDSESVFGNTPFADGEMANFVMDNFDDPSDEAKGQRDKVIAALVAEANVPAQSETIAATGDEDIAEGKRLMGDDGLGCLSCHKFHDEGELGLAPDLTGYMSAQWLVDFIANPGSERFYSDENYDGPGRMPPFAQHPDSPSKNLLTTQQLELLARWLRGDDRDLAAKLKAQQQEAAD